MNNLTVVLPLKGRAELTERFLNYCTKKGLRVLVVDGSRPPQHFAAYHVCADYHSYASDRGPADYWFKMDHAISSYVKTKYVIVCDNDDYPLPAGLARSIEFLDEHQDYVCHSGRIGGFWMFGPGDSLSSMTRRYSPYDKPADYDSDSAAARVLAGFANSWSYFAVYRTEVLQKLWASVKALDFKDFQVQEKFLAMETLALGKAKCDGGYVSVMRQYGTSMQSAKLYPSTTDEKITDIRKVLAVMGSHGIEQRQLVTLWRDWYWAWRRRNYGLKAMARRQLKSVFPRLARAYQEKRFAIWQPSVRELLHDA